MNETLNLQHSHRSDRSFTDEALSEDMLDAIVKAAHLAPTSMNSQQISLVVVRDPERRARIAEIAGGQPWIAKVPVFITVVVDFNKTRLGVEAVGTKQIVHESLEGYTAGAVDAGIALANMMVAARSLGLGIVPIGGIRRNPQAMIDLLQLPPLTFPIAGICIGHIAQPSSQKPRLPIGSFRHDEHYHPEALLPAIAAYETILPDYWRSIGRADGLSWTQNLANAYTRVYYPETRPVANKQGFTIDK